MYINWDLAPEGTVQIQKDHDEALYWVNGRGDYWDIGWRTSWRDGWQTIATRPQTERKTVEDAVEYYGGQFPDAYDIAIGIAYSNNRITPFYKGSPISKGMNSPDSYIICTREEFEACVAAKSEPEWTHLHGPNPCKVIKGPNAYDQHVIEYKREGDWLVVMGETLKPIKPTITKSEAWDRIQVEGLTPQEVNERFTVK